MLLLGLLLVHVVRSDILYVVELARHGARYPINPYYDYLDTLGDAGQLTSVGMRQHFNLGRYLRRDYIESEPLLAQAYDHNQLLVWSTLYKRTMESAACQMLGLYPRGTGPKIPENVTADRLVPPFSAKAHSSRGNGDFGLPGGAQPIPIHNGEAFLQNCDNYLEWERLMIAENLEDYSNVTLHYAPLIEKLRRLFNLTAEQSTLVGLSRLYDTLLCDKYLGKGVPLSTEELDNLRHLHYYLYMMIHSGLYSKIISTPLFTKILADFDQRLLNASSQRRMTVFVGHDTNISPTLSLLNFSSFQCIEDAWQKRPLGKYLNCEDGPGFASNIVIELRRQNAGIDPYVKVLYNGKQMNLCQRRQTTCPYSEWRKSVADSFVNFEELCRIPKRGIAHDM